MHVTKIEDFRTESWLGQTVLQLTTVAFFRQSLSLQDRHNLSNCLHRASHYPTSLFHQVQMNLT